MVSQIFVKYQLEKSVTKIGMYLKDIFRHSISRKVDLPCYLDVKINFIEHLCCLQGLMMTLV